MHLRSLHRLRSVVAPRSRRHLFNLKLSKTGHPNQRRLGNNQKPEKATRPSRPATASGANERPDEAIGMSWLAIVSGTVVLYTSGLAALGYVKGSSEAEKYDIFGFVSLLKSQGLLGSTALAPVELSKPQAVVSKKVYFDVDIGDQHVGRIVIGLYGASDGAPRTAENFLRLCEGHKAKDGRVLTYKNCIFHRIIPGFMVQGGDITAHNGTGGTSIYGGSFRDEPNALNLRHVGAGVLSMANRGPNTQTSQFFITTKETKWLDGRHSVFGVVLDGQDILQKIEGVGSRSGRPSKRVVISDCGVLRG